MATIFVLVAFAWLSYRWAVTILMAGPEHAEATALGRFQSTHWSLVQAAGQAGSPQAQEALERLCASYWYPVYAFVRRWGHEAETAKDLTQEFFLRLIAKEYLRVADREKGRFRTFLLACVERFLHNEHKKERTLKRGGHYTFVPLEASRAEDHYQAEPGETLSPAGLLDRRWALTVLDLSFRALQREYLQAGKASQFEALQECLSGAKEAPCSFAEIGARLNMTEAAARQAACRMRARFGDLLRQNVAQTVASPQDLEAELRHMRAVLSGRSGAL